MKKLRRQRQFKRPQPLEGSVTRPACRISLSNPSSAAYSLGMFEKRSDAGYHPALDGVERKTLVHGAKTLMTEFRLRKGSVLPRHSHPYEQTGCLVEGRVRLLIGTEHYEAQVGDSWCIPEGVEHGADILEDSVAIEVFSPVRDDYLPGRK
jgi:quercetin dioxygenase-like cupin family protein